MSPPKSSIPTSSGDQGLGRVSVPVLVRNCVSPFTLHPFQLGLGTPQLDPRAGIQTTPGSPRHEIHEEVWESGEEYGEWEDHQEGPGNSVCSLSPHLIPLIPETLAETFLSAAQCLLFGAWASLLWTDHPRTT